VERGLRRGSDGVNGGSAIRRLIGSLEIAWREEYISSLSDVRLLIFKSPTRRLMGEVVAERPSAARRNSGFSTGVSSLDRWIIIRYDKLYIITYFFLDLVYNCFISLEFLENKELIPLINYIV
jgi:hypothetical protein